LSTRRQTVKIGRREYDFDAWEPLHTEISRKYYEADVACSRGGRVRRGRALLRRATVVRQRALAGGPSGGREVTEADGERAHRLALRYRETRALTERLCEPLATEDYVVQSMPDASPVKWHIGHTTWFFETFVLAPHQSGFRPYDDSFGFIHNSYYEAVGARQPRAHRGMLTRPTVEQVYAYRASVDDRVAELLTSDVAGNQTALDLVELGINHEQQHQELLLTDLQHLLHQNPLRPSLTGPGPQPSRPLANPGFIEHGGGLIEIGHDGDGFAFDNERPRHRVHLEPFALSSALTTAGEFAGVHRGRWLHAPRVLAVGWLGHGAARGVVRAALLGARGRHPGSAFHFAG